MKTRLLIILFAAIFACANISAQTQKEVSDKLDFKETVYDFGTITQKHEPIVHEFEFVNNTGAPVAILSVSTSCGCTKPEYPKEPVANGKSGKIKITFDPDGQKGSQSKHIVVRYQRAMDKDTKRQTLRLNGNVVKKAKK